MRKSILVLVTMATALAGAGCMSDNSESSARRPAAMVGSAASYSHVVLNLGGSQSTWRSFSWGLAVEVIELKSTDRSGRPILNLLAGPQKTGSLTLERGLSADSEQFSQLFATDNLVYSEVMLSLVGTDGNDIGSYTLSSVLVADLKHASGAQAVDEMLTLRYVTATYQAV